MEKARWFRRVQGVAVLLVAILMGGCATIEPVPVGHRQPDQVEVFSHELFGQVLEDYVDEQGQVDYARLLVHPEQLNQYYRQVASYSPDSAPQLFPTTNHVLAYWINAYNATAIMGVLNAYPISSVKDIKPPMLFFFLPDVSGFFLFQRFVYGQATTSLYYLENSVIRKRFNDPRIHFALNCASRGCPRLPAEPFIGEQLDAQLDRETRKFIGEPRNFFIDDQQKVIRLSSIFKWYTADFTDWLKENSGRSNLDLLDYIEMYLEGEQVERLARVRGRYSLDYVDYDWGLNDQNRD